MKLHPVCRDALKRDLELCVLRLALEQLHSLVYIPKQGARDLQLVACPCVFFLAAVASEHCFQIGRYYISVNFNLLGKQHIQLVVEHVVGVDGTLLVLEVQVFHQVAGHGAY